MAPPEFEDKAFAPQMVLDSKAQSPAYFFRSKLPNIEIPDHMALPEYCLQHSANLASKPCLIEMGSANQVVASQIQVASQNQVSDQSHVTTYDEVTERAKRVAARLEPVAGIKKGDVVMLMIPNSSEFVVAFLGVAMRGAIVTTCNPFYKSQEIEKQLSASGAKLIITQLSHIHKIANIRAPQSFRVMVIDHDPHDLHQPQDHLNHLHQHLDHPPIDSPHLVSVLHFSSLVGHPDDDKHEMFGVDDFDHVHPDDVVALPYSSGTTGLPKGVMLTHRNLVTSISQQVDGENPNMYFTPDDIVLCVLPMFHIYSLSIVLCCLRVGATMAIMPKFEIEALLEVVQRHRVTVAPLVPPIVLALAKNPIVQRYDLSSIRMLMCGAAPLSKDLQDSFKARVPHAIVAQGYGMTEAGSVLSMSLAFAKYPSPVKSGSCGTVLRNTIVKLIDPETGVSVGHNQPGEICIKGNQIMKGYLNDSVATSNTIDEDGFLHTGDIGIIDDDDELFIVDRVKEIIKFKGFQVPPAELEGILISHPSVVDAACVPKKDEAAGEVPVAFVVPTKGSQVTENELKQFVANQVIFYKKLHKIIFVDHIPKSPSGKILRKELRKRIEEENI